MADVKFCTSDDVKQYLPVAAGYTQFDPVIDQLVLDATRAVQNFCRRSFVKGQYVEYHPTKLSGSTTDLQYVFLREFPIDRSVTPVVKLNYARDWANAAPLDADYWRVSDSHNVIELWALTSRHPQSLQVTYTAGYEADQTDANLILVDADLKMATAVQAAFWAGRVVESNLGQQDNPGRPIPLRLAPGAVHNLTPEAAQMCAKFRRNLGSQV